MYPQIETLIAKTGTLRVLAPAERYVYSTRDFRCFRSSGAVCGS